MRGVDKWTIRRIGKHLGETDTFVEAERLAHDTPQGVRYTAPQRYALVTEATEAAREMGLSVRGTDVYGHPDIW